MKELGLNATAGTDSVRQGKDSNKMYFCIQNCSLCVIMYLLFFSVYFKLADLEI